MKSLGALVSLPAYLLVVQPKQARRGDPLGRGAPRRGVFQTARATREK